ncbi:2-hydroxyacid dehydrogenase [Demequina sediminicola]|uniref:2-hydroxyacid dehydrogenase n=1 Tax=Demequina sediminicola TaxID=1095026 RepID=UPI00078320D3|nr:2-hydroxyacid dehydrogenase [Demequina sediminicola]
MITVSVPDTDTADAVGDVGDDARVVVWNPAVEDAPAEHAEGITLACLAHRTGGRKVYARLRELPNLQAIQIPSAGYEHALPYVPDGVALCNARGVHDTRTAEMALLLALASQRGLPQFIDAQRRETWEPYETAPSLADKKVLVVGYGSIGAAIGKRMRACEATVEGVARSARTAPDGTTVHAVGDLLTLLPQFDIVVIVTPHDDTTDRLVNGEFLSSMADDALLVNVGRGAVVDTDALVAELQTGRIRATLDVVDPEPLPDGHPLYSAPGLVLTPHVAGFAQTTDKRYVALVHAQIASLRAGKGPVNRVN